MKDSQNTFILGLGGQKCGTTWLSSYLKSKPNYVSGVAKEYHVWDALDIPECRNWRIDFLTINKTGPKVQTRHKMQNDDRYYFDYFASLFSDEKNISADITPSYSGLEPDRLLFIKKQFEKVGITVKAVILIREPVSRIKSAVRYNLDKLNYTEGVLHGEKNFTNAVRQYYKTSHCKLRTSYNTTIESAIRVFGEKNIFVGVYENLFTPEEIRRMSDFIGVDTDSSYTAKVINKTANLTEDIGDLEAEIVDHYSDVYTYCFEKFPVTQSLWSRDNEHFSSFDICSKSQLV